MRLIKYLLGIFFIIVFSGVIWFWWIAMGYGPGSIDWSHFELAKVVFDKQGIPTIEAKDWDSLVEAQGYVTASDRMFQMDLIRRSSVGRLSEWFGEQAVTSDLRRKKEDWQAVVSLAEKDLPEEQKHFCALYAKGVNRFIQEERHHAGLEYRFLRKEPESWSCQDSLSVVLAMSEDLSATYEDEIPRTLWHKALPLPWEQFLFTSSHPWNETLFGSVPYDTALPQSQYLAKRPLTDEEKKMPLSEDEELSVLGSNSWVTRSDSNNFLANDPHLNLSVPILWYPVRLRISSSEWVVGASVPGLPGVILGMNQNAAWAFTNLLEDVDDLLLEEISSDGKSYVAEVTESGGKIFRPIEERRLVIHVSGAKDKEVVARFTHRGPLQKYVPTSDSYYSRQWLGFQRGKLQIPTLSLNRIKNWEDFNSALDAMMTPAQNVLYSDRSGGIGYRSSGTGVVRAKSGFVIRKATEGQWAGFEPQTKRHRLFLSPDPKASNELVVANQRVYQDKENVYWSSDLRAERIKRGIKEAGITLSLMEQLQRDTESRFHKLLADWIVSHSSSKNHEEELIIKKWKNWDGKAESAEDAFAELEVARRVLRDILISRVTSNFISPGSPIPSYKWRLDNAWVIRTLEAQSGLSAFGLDEKDVAQYLLDRISKYASAYQKGYAYHNRWRTQHPFVNLPVIGWIFKINEEPQTGFLDLVNSSQPRKGPGIRVVWDLNNIHQSRWILPVGESGHVLTRHFSDQRKDWFKQKSYPVFDATFEWN